MQIVALFIGTAVLALLKPTASQKREIPVTHGPTHGPWRPAVRNH